MALDWTVAASLLPLREKVPEGRMRGVPSHALSGGKEPLTRLALRAIHPLPQGERGGSEIVETAYGHA